MTGYRAHAVTHDSELSGTWSTIDQNQHINVLELKAAFLALKEFCFNAYDEHVQLFLDNTTAIKYLNKMGGRKTPLNELAKTVWLWCIERRI